jgi:hypothetical protein
VSVDVDLKALNDAVAKGLPMPFAVAKSGEVLVADATASYQEKLAQVALVIFETISALGEVKIATIEVIGDKKGIIMDLDDDGLLGTIFQPQDDATPVEYMKLLRELRIKPVAAVPMGRMALVDPSILSKIKSILQEYVGDFTDRIFENQMKNQGIKAEELHGEDVRRLILALGKATGMIVGRKKGRELSSKLTELVK